MKKKHTIFLIILFIIVGCGGGKQSTDDLIFVDVLKSYPKKEIILQDFLDIEYIALDNSDEFITRGLRAKIGKNFIVVRNASMNADILFYDRKTGKGIRKINRQGQGPEEYQAPAYFVIDEENNEMFVSAGIDIAVYDLFGNFKRRFNSMGEYAYDNIVNFDQNHLFFENSLYKYQDEVKFRYRIMSKQDGSITKEIEIPYKKKITERFDLSDGNFTSGPNFQRLVPDNYSNNWTLAETSSDTIYRMLPDCSMTPIIVRTPSIQSMNPPEIFLSPMVFTDRYILMQTISKDRESFYPRRDLMWDRQENAIFEYVIFNADYLNERSVKTEFDIMIIPFLDNETAFAEKIEAYELVEAYKKGQLKGRLKEIAADLNEESNPVFMIAKHRK